MEIEKNDHPNTDNEQLITDARLVFNAALNEKDDLLKIVKDTHRRKNELVRVVEEGQTPFFNALKSTRSQLINIEKRGDNEAAIKALEIFKRFASPIYNDQNHIYAFFTTEADIAEKLLEDHKSYRHFNEVLPFGLKTVMESIEKYNREHSLFNIFESTKAKIHRKLNEAVSHPFQLSRQERVTLSILEALKKMGPIFAVDVLEKYQDLSNEAKDKPPSSNAGLERIITTSKLILNECLLREISDLQVKVLGQLSLEDETMRQKLNIIKYASEFDQAMQNGRWVNKLLGANRNHSLHSFGARLTKLYKGWFAYRSLEVDRGVSSQVWGTEIKKFNWEKLIKNGADLYELRENNFWIL